MEIFYRADGNTLIGLGHLTRCLALAQMLMKDFKQTFVCKEITQNLIDEIKTLGIGLKIIEKEDDFLADLEKSAIVVVDHYGLSTNYQKELKKKDAKVVVIDDLCKGIFFADLIINHAPGITAAAYNAQTYTQYALGLDYVLLRPVFLEMAKEDSKHDKDIDVFICFGGSDSKNLTQKTISSIKLEDRFKTIHIVIGAAYLNYSSLVVLIANDPRFIIHNAITSANIANLIARSKLAIVPASGILLEALAIGCKIISGMYVENQKNFFEEYKNLNAFISADNFEQNSIVNALAQYFSNQSCTSTKLIDGKSKERNLNFFKQLALEADISIKVVDENDLDLTYHWANNLEIRKFFFSKGEIDFKTHSQWFKNRLIDENCIYYIGILNGAPFGSIRFDLKEGLAVVSYLIDPKYQGCGLGTIILKRGLEELIASKKQGIKKVYGEVLPQNMPSIKVFQKLGYQTSFNEELNLYTFEKIIPN